MKYLTRGRLSLRRLVASVARRRFGAIATFSGCVRDTEKGRRIASITYEAYARMAERELGRIVVRAKKRWRVAVALKHRVGRVGTGRASVVIACAGVHRREAFAAWGRR